jgi:hypothetical protein
MRLNGCAFVYPSDALRRPQQRLQASGSVKLKPKLTRDVCMTGGSADRIVWVTGVSGDAIARGVGGVREILTLSQAVCCYRCST